MESLGIAADSTSLSQRNVEADMATRSGTVRLAGEPRFFFTLAVVLTAIVIVGFALQPVLGRVHYPGLPVALYFHGLLFVTWCALAVVQPVLIGTGQRRMHRALGWFGLALALGMTFSGIRVTMDAVIAGRVAPAELWMAMNILSMVAFLALVAGGVAVRRATDWHRRLLACATIIMTGPAWARILPVHLFGPFTLIVLTVVVLAFVGWGMAYDRRTRGRIHPAWYIGALGVAMPGLFTLPLAMVPPFGEWARALS